MKRIKDFICEQSDTHGMKVIIQSYYVSQKEKFNNLNF